MFLNFFALLKSMCITKSSRNTKLKIYYYKIEQGGGYTPSYSVNALSGPVMRCTLHNRQVLHSNQSFTFFHHYIRRTCKTNLENNSF